MGIPRARISLCRVLHTVEWEGEQGLCELALVDALHGTLVRTSQTDQRRERWLVLVVEITSYPETCAEHGAARSASAPAFSLSTFIIIFFSKYARASSTGRSSALFRFPIILKCFEC